MPTRLTRLVTALFLGPTAVRLFRLFRRRGDRTKVESIFIVKLDRIGDFVLFTPFLRELRANYPRARIALVANRSVAPLAAPCPYIDTIEYAESPTPGWRGVIETRRQWKAIVRKLYPDRGPDLAFYPRYEVDLYHGYSLLAMASAGTSVAHDTRTTASKRRANAGWDRFLDIAVAEGGSPHEIDKNLALLEAVNGTVSRRDQELWLPDAPDPLGGLGIPLGARLVALCPYSAEEYKNWPLEHFLALAEQFAERPEVVFALVAGPDYSDHQDDPRIRAVTNLRCLAGKLSLVDTARLLGRCAAVVSVDTGTAHIAAALARPTVVLGSLRFGEDPTSHYAPERFCPRGARVAWIAPDPSVPKSMPPIRGVAVQSVVVSLREALGLGETGAAVHSR